MKNIFAVLRSKGFKVVAAATATSLAVIQPAYADIEAEIAAAQSAGISQVTLAIGAVVAICALVMGLNIIIGLIKK
jgi:hypothetical protein